MNGYTFASLYIEPHAWPKGKQTTLLFEGKSQRYIISSIWSTWLYHEVAMSVVNVASNFACCHFKLQFDRFENFMSWKIHRVLIVSCCDMELHYKNEQEIVASEHATKEHHSRRVSFGIFLSLLSRTRWEYNRLSQTIIVHNLIVSNPSLSTTVVLSSLYIF